jgi:AraC-like DNA-binding protein
VQYALSTFRAQPSVARVREVTDEIALSPKRFIERFKADVGVTPKRYCRLLRFQGVVARAHNAGQTPIEWAALALDCGYFDQAHLIHEFREFSGLAPTAYEAHRTTFQNHVTFLQSPDDWRRAECSPCLTHSTLTAP